MDSRVDRSNRRQTQTPAHQGEGSDPATAGEFHDPHEGGKTMMTFTKGDIEVIFGDHHNGECVKTRVDIVVGGHAETRLTLQEFFELMADAGVPVLLTWQLAEGRRTFAES